MHPLEVHAGQSEPQEPDNVGEEFYSRGDWGSPTAKILPVPQMTAALFFDQRLSPNWVLSLKISKFYLIFPLNFDYFLAQNYIRMLFFMLITKICSYFAVRGIFDLSCQFSQAPLIWPHPWHEPPHLTPSLMRAPPPPPTKNHPRKQVPTKNFVKNPRVNL